MQNHRPEHNENMNGKASLLFCTLSSLEKAPGYSRRLQQTLSNPKRYSKTSPNTKINPNLPQALPFPKAPTRQTRGHLKDIGNPQTSTRTLQTDPDPVGTKLLPKLTADGHLGISCIQTQECGKPAPPTASSTIPRKPWMLGFFGLGSQYFLNSIHSLAKFYYWMWWELKGMEVLKSKW